MTALIAVYGGPVGTGLSCQKGIKLTHQREIHSRSLDGLQFEKTTTLTTEAGNNKEPPTKIKASNSLQYKSNHAAPSKETASYPGFEGRLREAPTRWHCEPGS